MQEYMKHDTFEERLVHMVFGFGPFPEYKIELGEGLTKAVNEVLDELTERERIVLLNHVKDCETNAEQAAKYEVSEDTIRVYIGKALRKLRHPRRSRRLAVFVRMPSEDRIEKVFAKNPELMEEYSITTPKEFIKALGDRYNCETRNAIMSRLTAKEQAWVKEFYLRNCNAGIDRGVACIKVTIKWMKGAAWTPVGRDYLSEVTAEYDRLKSTVKYSTKTYNGVIMKLQSAIDAEFEDIFFSTAEQAQWMTENDETGSYSIDNDPVSIECESGEGFICEMEGNTPNYHPYDRLYEMSQELFRKLRKQAMDL